MARRAAPVASGVGSSMTATGGEEAAELQRLLSATIAELFDARALAAQLDRRRGQRRVGTDSVIEDLREGYGRRHDDTCKLTTCQCGEWDPTTKRYVVAP